MASRKTPARKAKPRSTSSSNASGDAPGKARKQRRLAPGEWFEKLVALQARLRAPNGCPWDREQTHASLRTYLIEEAYEVLDAMKSGDDAKFAEEMGDLLLQIVFHSQIAAEQGRFTVGDVIREVHEKMVRRHPHVFGEKRAKDAAEVLRNWEQIKARERAGNQDGGGGVEIVAVAKRESLLDGVPGTLPAALEGLQLTRRASRAGFDWENAEGIFEKLREESAELRHATQTKDAVKTEEEMGDLLLQIVFHSQIAAEEKRFTVADVIREVHEKTVRRHPHVFGEKRAKDAAEVLRNWEQIKARERAGNQDGAGGVEAVAKRESLLDGVPGTLPATLEGLQLTRKASRAGFDWDNAGGVFEKLREESAELRHATQTKDAVKTEEEMGDLLFAAVNLARFLQVDPEIALKNANAKFARRFRQMERLAASGGRAFGDVPRAEKEALWERIKRGEKQAAGSEAHPKR